jgi:N-acyl-D-amino-acid deacylase
MSAPQRCTSDRILIHGGAIVDGSGAEPFLGDILIEDGRIREVGHVTEVGDTYILDASDCVVSPGFIDIHSHSDFTLLIDPRAVSAITQGVTLEVVGNCGHGCAPISDPELVRSNIYGCQSDYDITWRTMGEYLDRLESRCPAVNVLSLVPNGNLRLAVMGWANRAAVSDELTRMSQLLDQSLSEGAWGLSTGLEYGPEIGCSEDEITALCRLTSSHDNTFYATHTRNRDGQPEEAIAEPIRSSTAASIPLQISHVSVVSRLTDDSHWAVEQALDQIDHARKHGFDVAFDMHTRPFGTTNLSAVLPTWALEGTKSDIAARLSDEFTRDKLKGHRSIISALARRGWDNVVIYDSRAKPEYAHQSIAEISRQSGVQPFDCIYDLLLAEIDDLHNVMILGFAYRPEDLTLAFEHPHCMVGSDATALAPDGPLCASTFHGAYTWAGWFYRYFVRERRLFTCQEAIRRLTSLPASRLRLPDRGSLRIGAWGDVTVFDPVIFGERGTTFEPNQTASGVKHVLVNGKIAVENGSVTKSRSGHVLRRT